MVHFFIQPENRNSCVSLPFGNSPLHRCGTTIFGQLEKLGYTYRGTSVGLVVPDYSPIQHVSDLSDYRTELDGEINGIEPGAAINEQTRRILENNGIDGFQVVASSGPALVAAALLLAGLLSFDGLAGLAPAALFVSMNAIEGQFVTPALVGRHMHVNPLLVFLSLVFWLWLWGPIGGIVAIPVLVWTLYLLGRLDWEPEGTTVPTPPPLPGEVR